MPKTLKLKSPEPTISAKPAAPAGGNLNESQEGIYVASRHRNPSDGASAVRPENWTWAAILGIVAAVLVAATLLVEWMDWSFLRFA